jgi:effector-binding domain-containing protein
LTKALENVRRQMEGDFNMITRRYAKLFQSLNEALETRVKELDRPAMQLAGTRKNMVFDKHKDNSSMLLSISDEVLPLVQTALSGKLKQKTRDAMRTLAESVYENHSYSEKVGSILMKNQNDFSDHTDLCYLPALDKRSFTLSEKVQKQLLSESSSNAVTMNLLGIEELSSSKTLVFASSLNRKALEVLKTLHDYITQEFRINSLISTFLFNEETDNPLSVSIPVIWSESDMPEGGMVNREFNTLAESYFSGAGEDTERVYRTMLSLWQNAQMSLTSFLERR